MTKSFFVSDQHFSHFKIIEYCNRSFSSITEMNDTIINNHNSVVTSADDVYILGDFAFVNNIQSFDNIINQLNGRKFFILGSHDRIVEHNLKYLLRHFVWIKEKAEIKINKQDITLCHYPMWSWAKSHYGSWQLFGHHHGRLNSDHRSPDKINLTDRLQLDVGVDCWNFSPVSFEQIKEIMDKKNFVPIHKRKKINDQSIECG